MSDIKALDRLKDLVFEIFTMAQAVKHDDFHASVRYS